MDEVKWIVGVIVGIVTMIGGLVTRDRQVMHRIDDGDRDIREELHALGDKVKASQDSIKRDYVRRDDLKEHLQTIEKMLEQARADQKDLTRRIDSFITTVNNGRRD